MGVTFASFQSIGTVISLADFMYSVRRIGVISTLQSLMMDAYILSGPGEVNRFILSITFSILLSSFIRNNKLMRVHYTC